MYAETKKYELIKLIGKGSFGQVFRAKIDDLQSSSGQKEIALKVIRTNSEQEQKIVEREISILKKLGQPCHPAIACYYGSEKIGNKYYIEMEYISGKDLGQFAYTYSLDKNFFRYIMDIMSELLGGIKYIHSLDILHRDIKPDNIIIQYPELQPKLIDMGLACYESRQPRCDNEKCCLGYAGTAYFMSPESLLKNVAYPKSDIWSLAASIYYVITRTHVYEPLVENMGELKKLARQSVELLPTGNLFLDELLEGMLEKDIEKRMSAEASLMFLEKHKPQIV